MNSALQHPVPQKLLIQIGDMTVSFALLEFQIHIVFSSLISENLYVGQIITTQLSFAGLCKIVNALYVEQIGKDEDYKTLIKLLKQANEVEQERNKITHSLWASGSKHEFVTRIKMTKSNYQMKFEEYDEAKFVVFNKRIKELSRLFLDFYLDLVEKTKIVSNSENHTS